MIIINGFRGVASGEDRAVRRRRWLKRGFTALELAVTLGALGVLALGVGYYTGPLADKRRYQKWVTDTQLITTNTSGVYQGAFGSTTPSVATLIANGSMPQSVITAAGGLQNAFGGQIVYTPNTSTAYLDQDQIPQQYCEQFFLNIPATTSNVAVAAGATVASLSSATTYAPGSAAQGAAATACGAGNNAIRIQFK